MDWLNFFRIAGYVALAFGVICTIGVDYLKNKEDKRNELTSDKKMNELMTDVKDSKKLLEPFNDLANRLYPNLNQSDALEKLSTRLDQVDEDILSGKKKIDVLTKDKNTIKTLDVLMVVEFSGKWSGDPYPTWYQPVSPRTFLKWMDKDKKLPDIEFAAPRINIKKVNENTAIFENVLTVQSGSETLGESIDILKSYEQMHFWIIFTEPKNLIDPKIEINKIRLLFSINGSRKGEIILNEKMIIDMSEPLSKVDNVNSILTPTITLDGKLFETLKIKLD
jgi:hypothetical protein